MKNLKDKGMLLGKNLFVTLLLSSGLTLLPVGTRSEPIINIPTSNVHPKISIVPSRFSEARLELGHGASDDTFEYPSVRIALNDEVSAEISQPLPLNNSVHGVVGERDVKMYASKLPPSGGGALKLFVQARGRPEPSQAAPLIVSVRTRDGGYTFTLPQLTRGDMHHHPNPIDGDAVNTLPTPVYGMSVSRFMCPSAGERDVCYVTMGVGTSVGPDVEHVVYDYDLRLMELDAGFWYLNTSSAPRGVVITPVTPALFQYRWPPDRSVQAVRVAVSSGDPLRCAADTRACVGGDCGEQGDANACAFLAVHSPICPLTLTPAEILASAQHLSFTRCGTMVVRRKLFPKGFFVSVLLHSDDTLCCPRQHCNKNDTVTRRKSVRVSVMSYKANLKAAAAPALVGAMFIVIGLVSICLRPVLARAAVSSAWEPVAVAKAISSRVLGHKVLKSFQPGLELDGDEKSESIVTVRENTARTEGGTIKYDDSTKTDLGAAKYGGDSHSGTDNANYRNSWQSGTDTVKHSDSPWSGRHFSAAHFGNSSQSGTDTIKYSGSLLSGPGAINSDSLRTKNGSLQHSDDEWEGTHTFGSDDVRSGPGVIKHSGAANRVTDIKYSNGTPVESSFVHFSDSVQTVNGTVPRRNAGDVRQPPDQQSSPLLLAKAPNLIVLNPVSLQVTCALLIAAFGISNVAIDVAAERRTGNFDRCFRNDLCCHDGQVMPDLNHLLSNVPYIGAGIGFLLAVYAQWHVYEVAMSRGRGRARGVPHDFNLFTAIGAALAIEGVTSGLYHVCPNNRNSHIDFFFIYYLCAAMGAKLFQTRRGVTARFHYTPAMLVAGITLLGSLQQVPGMTPQSWQRAVVLTHFSSSFLWATQMYLTGHVGLFVPWCWEIMSDLRTRRLAAAHIILNGSLALWGLFWASSGADVFHSSTYALLYFSLNSGLYVCYYMIMKLVVCRERPPWLSVFNILVGIASAVPALYFFIIRRSYNTNESPAMSRTVNHPCILLDFYDGHDIWHFLSAAALFFLMLGLLTLDDDLLATPRDRIPVF